MKNNEKARRAAPSFMTFAEREVPKLDPVFEAFFWAVKELC